jgi:tetratricopeptide (TPR) repeat protein
MPTLKELGNQAFKSNKYKEAIKYYDEYVQEQHADNKNAFFNLGLCFSKIGDH